MDRPPPFEPLFRNPHLLTVLGNFWPRNFDYAQYPEQRRLIRTDEDTQVLVQTQVPAGSSAGEVVLLHGLEGGGGAGYIRSLAWHALQSGFTTHRFHMRTCGGTETLCKTLYHGGLTSDLRSFLEQTRFARQPLPAFLIGFSLGGNVALKLAGELGETDLIHGVCAVSTPIDLGRGARRIGEIDNRIYERRFVKRMKQRLAATGRYTGEQLEPWQSIYDIDDNVTAPSFGFRNADHYYATQSSKEYLDSIRVPTLVIQSKDDTFVPFDMFDHPAFRTNPNLHLLATDHGGHLGFLSRRGPRFWVDTVAIEFLQGIVRGDPAIRTIPSA